MKNFPWDKKYLYWGVTAFSVVIASIVFYMSLEYWPLVRGLMVQTLNVLNPLLWGLVIAYLLNPLMRMYETKLFLPLAGRLIKKEEKRASFSRASAVILALVTMAFVIWELIWMVLPQVYASLVSLAVNLPDYVRQGADWLDALLTNYPELEETALALVGNASQSLTNWLSSFLPQFQSIVTGLSTSIIAFLRVITNILVGIVFSVYILMGKEGFGAQIKKLLYSILPVKFVEESLKALHFTHLAFSNFFIGKVLDSLIIGIICYIGCAILNIPYNALVSVVVGITNIIPFFGPFIGAMPCALIILMVSPTKCLIFILFIVVLQQVDGNIIGPRILSGTIGLSGFWIMFAIIVSSGAFGFIGMLCGVPLFAVIYTVAQGLVNRRLRRRGLPTDREWYKKNPEGEHGNHGESSMHFSWESDGEESPDNENPEESEPAEATQSSGDDSAQNGQ